MPPKRNGLCQRKRNVGPKYSAGNEIGGKGGQRADNVGTSSVRARAVSLVLEVGCYHGDKESGIIRVKFDFFTAYASRAKKDDGKQEHLVRELNYTRSRISQHDKGEKAHSPSRDGINIQDQRQDTQRSGTKGQFTSGYRRGRAMSGRPVCCRRYSREPSAFQGASSASRSLFFCYGGHSTKHDENYTT